MGPQTIKYDREGVTVSAFKKLKGQHKEFSLCQMCKSYGSEVAGCLVGEELCKQTTRVPGLAISVMECPDFDRKEKAKE